MPDQYSCVGYQQLTVSTTAVALTVPAGGVHVALIRTSGDVRFREDGTNPTAAVGMQLLSGETYRCDGQPEDIKFIRSGGADATLDVSFYA